MKKLTVVVTFVAGAAVGFTACGALVVNGVLKSERHREGLVNAISEKVERWLYGEDLSVGQGRPKSKVSYSNVYYNRHNSQMDEDCFIFETHEKAESILDEIKVLINTHGHVSLAEVYDLCSMTPRATHYECGWNTAEGMKVIKTRNGYELYLPKPVTLDEV